MSIDWDKVIAELQKPDGWIKGEMGEYYDPDAPVCLYGAMCRAEGLTLSKRDERLVAVIIRAQFPQRAYGNGGGWEVPSFNDHPDTTLDDVILVCEKARAEG